LEAHVADLLQVVITEDGQGYYLSDGETETEESVDWGTPLDFNGVSYLADVDETGDVVTLAKIVELPDSAFEVVSEGDDSEDEDEEQGVEVGPE
jgi:hypothetical protein